MLVTEIRGMMGTKQKQCLWQGKFLQHMALSGMVLGVAEMNVSNRISWKMSAKSEAVSRGHSEVWHQLVCSNTLMDMNVTI